MTANETSPVYVIDDDVDDQEIVRLIWRELNLRHPLVFFDSTEHFLLHIKSDPTNPLLVLCDINIPRKNGFRLRKKLLEDQTLNYKTIPFVFWSTAVSDEKIKEAYDLHAHGIFIKTANFEALKNTISNIISYWKKSEVPQV